MKKQVVFYQSGEIQGTYSPKCFVENFTGNLEEKTTRLISHDMWEPIECNMFRIYEIEMPDWFTEQYFLDHHISLRWAQAFGMPENFTRTQFENFTRLGEKYRYFICWIFEKYSNTKNAFMQSIKTQIENWLSDEQPRYGQPLSEKQFEAASKFCPLYEAKRISARTYWSR